MNLSEIVARLNNALPGWQWLVRDGLDAEGNVEFFAHVSYDRKIYIPGETSFKVWSDRTPEAALLAAVDAAIAYMKP